MVAMDGGANCFLNIPSLREGRGRRIVAAVGGDEGEPPVDDGGNGDEQDDDEVVVHGRPVVVRQLMLPRPRLLLLSCGCPLVRRLRRPRRRWAWPVGGALRTRRLALSQKEAFPKFLQGVSQLVD